MSRVIKGLKWAVSRESGPFGPSRPRGAKALGVRYEKELAAACGPGALRGQWFQFEDAAGGGWCQVDVLLRWGSTLVALEAKYTWVAEGHQQLEQLYLPVLRSIVAGRQQVVGVLVAKRLVPQLSAGMRGITIVRSLASAIDCAEHGGRPVLHWIGDIGALKMASQARLAANEGVRA